MDTNIYVCPHCNEFVIVQKMRCGLFIHAINKKTGKQLNPHVERINKNKIIGCGNKFEIQNGILLKK